MTASVDGLTPGSDTAAGASAAGHVTGGPVAAGASAAGHVTGGPVAAGASAAGDVTGGTVAAKVVAALDRLARGQRAHRQRVATAHGLSPLQVDLLATVGDGGPPEPLVGQLARELAVSQPTATDSTRSLERKGLVDRVADPSDGRRTLVELTPAGASLLDQLTGDDRLLVDAVSGLDAARQERLLDALLDLIATFVDASVIDVARVCTTCAFHVAPADGGHRCTLLGADLSTPELRVNCSEHIGCRVETR